MFLGLFAAVVITASVVVGGGFAIWLNLASGSQGCHSVLSQSCSWGESRLLKRLEKPVVLLISSDGFRWGYNHKVPTPNIDRLRVHGTEAAQGLIPVFPSVTFPNHYSIVTGLYSGQHGIIANYFHDPSNQSDVFTMTNHNPRWWLGEPIWQTAVKQGLNAATYFWPGSEVKKNGWSCPPQYCKHYNFSVPYSERIDGVLAWLDLPPAQRPNIVTLYFEEPDHTGHSTGPDMPQLDTAIARVDASLGRLLAGLDARGLFEEVNIILLGDHGMVSNCLDHVVYLEDFKPWISGLDPTWIDNLYPLLAIRPPPGVDLKKVLKGFAAATKSGKIQNAEYLKIYAKEDLPARFNYSGSPRIQPILGVAAESYSVAFSRSSKQSSCWGSHGYDNQLLSMRTIFIGHGPRFARGRHVPSFRNVEVYAVIANILGLRPAPHNGSAGFPSSLLLRAD